MDPVRIKLYGLVSMTRRGYILMLLVGVVLLNVMLAVWIMWMTRPSEVRTPAAGAPALILLVLNHMYLAVLVLAVLLGLEAYLVLRRFAREEALRQARQAESQPPPSTS